ncbi:MAG TPA: GNAT family N-acetyltransferase [Anaerolineae bacterium]
MGIEIVRLPAEALEAEQDQIVNIYREAFGPPPYNEGEAGVRLFAQSLARRVRRPGFRYVAARDKRHGRIVGFAFGYRCRPGQWWHDAVASALEPAAANRWLADAFELVELAVTPAYQGRGFGGRLHDALLTGLPYQTALLSTIQAETVALKLYRRRGWVTLLTDFVFPQGNRSFRIMGREL